jgi:hypothetical protein
MEINNITSTSGSQNEYGRSIGLDVKKTDPTLTPFPAGGVNQEAFKTPMGQMISISSSINYVSEQLKSILTSFPPFFPAGSPQRVDLIKEIKSIQEHIDKADIPKDMKKLAGPRLSNQASDEAIASALNGLNQFRDQTLKNTEISGTSDAGEVLNIKI